jgi:hypothetical protein
MTTRPSIAQQLERQSVVLMQSTIPGDMTCDQWRRRRSGGTSVPCDHLPERVIETRHYEPRVAQRTRRAP